jgi:hypothetical protein
VTGTIWIENDNAFQKALEERNAHCYRLLGTDLSLSRSLLLDVLLPRAGERPKPKIQSGFSYATGTTPIPLLLEKLSFLSTDESAQYAPTYTHTQRERESRILIDATEFLSTEGIFRVNADIGRVNAITEMWQKGGA